MGQKLTQRARKGSKLINVFIRFSGDEILVGKLLLDNRLIYFK